jgi:hypothetical protein
MVADVPSGPSWTPPLNNRIKKNNRSIELVGIVVGYGLDGPGSIPGMAGLFSSLQLPDWLWGLPSLLSNGCRVRLPRG